MLIRSIIKDIYIGTIIDVIGTIEDSMGDTFIMDKLGADIQDALGNQIEEEY